MRGSVAHKTGSRPRGDPAVRSASSTEQLIPWGAIALLGIAVLLTLVNDSPRLVAAVRLMALAVLLASVFGIYAHVAANYDAGALDQRYAETWGGVPTARRTRSHDATGARFRSGAAQFPSTL